MGHILAIYREVLLLPNVIFQKVRVMGAVVATVVLFMKHFELLRCSSSKLTWENITAFKIWSESVILLESYRVHQLERDLDWSKTYLPHRNMGSYIDISGSCNFEP